MKTKYTNTYIAAYFIIYLSLCLLIKGSGYTNQYYVLISVATFLFGIFIAFSIYNHQSRVSRIKELLRTDDSYLLTIYRQSAVFGDDVQGKVRKYIDEYLITQIDYKITDFHESTKAFKTLDIYVLGLHPTSDKQLAMYESMVQQLADSLINRKLVGTYARQKMTGLEWVSIISLHTLIAFFVLSFNDRKLSSSLLSTVLVVAGFIMILVLKELNNLTWQENDWIWQPLHNLFIDLDLLPYYPEMVIDQRRARVAPGSEVRICHYNKPYPDMSDNEVHVMTL